MAGSIGSLVHSRNPPSSPTVTPADIASFERLFQVWMNLWVGENKTMVSFTKSPLLHISWAGCLRQISS